MNNTTTRRNLTIVAIFMAATLVVGTLATTTITQTAFAFSKKKGGDDNSRNGNTITIQKCKQAATQSGFDNNQQQECENLICTHPGENATCVSEGAVATTPTTPTTPTTTEVSGQGEGQIFCPRASSPGNGSITFSAQENGGTVQGQFNMVLPGTIGGDKSGTLNGLQISGNSFIVTGTETASFCVFSQLPTTVTISGQCGTGVTIQFASADGEHATFTGNVECTTT